jgi:hypothetical protein
VKAVIDTNVLLVANGQHEDVSPDCVIECVRRLQEIQRTGIVVLDDGFRILSEYLHKTTANSGKRVGDVFLKWILRNTRNRRFVEQISVSETSPDEFVEFPDAKLQARFDAPDRKFAAVANAHPDRPPIWQAADCKWLDWSQTLTQQGICVDFLCPNDVLRFYSKKFPKKAVPEVS